MQVQRIIKNTSVLLFTFLLGAACSHFFDNKKIKSLETEIASYKEKLEKSLLEISTLIESKEKEQGKEVVKRQTEIRPDGTQIISEDIVRDFLIERQMKESVVLRQQVESIEKENTMLRQKIEEFKKPEYAFTILPSYNYHTHSTIYTFSAQKRVLFDCYLGLSFDRERVGVPLTCNF